MGGGNFRDGVLSSDSSHSSSFTDTFHPCDLGKLINFQHFFVAQMSQLWNADDFWAQIHKASRTVPGNCPLSAMDDIFVNV